MFGEGPNRLVGAMAQPGPNGSYGPAPKMAFVNTFIVFKLESCSKIKNNCNWIAYDTF